MLLTASTAFAQDDILLEQDFQNFTDDDFQIFPDSPDSDSIWISWDEDGIADFNDRAVNWFIDFQFILPDSIPPGEDTNYVASSSSWLEGFDPGNTNWLISPAIYISDDQATLHWKSSPFQGPRYMDGYTVKILEGSSNYDDATVTTVFEAAQMTSIDGEDASLNPADFTFSQGYVHADSYTDSTYFYAANPDDINGDFNIGLLEPHSVSLTDFSGKWVFVAIHHDSSDDNLIEVDDIMVMGNLLSSTKVTENDIRFVTYPNPVDNFLNVMFRTNEAAEVNLELYNQNGQLVAAKASQDNYVGEYNEQFDLRKMAAGTYNVVLTIDGQRFTKSVVRK